MKITQIHVANVYDLRNQFTFITVPIDALNESIQAEIRSAGCKDDQIPVNGGKGILRVLLTINQRNKLLFIEL